MVTPLRILYKDASFGSLIMLEIKVLRPREFMQKNMDIMRSLKDNPHHVHNKKIY